MSTREPPEWMGDAVCGQVDPELFFPDQGGNPRIPKSICAVCPVAAACLEYALVTEQHYGVWGGLSERERRPLRQARMAAAGRAACGTRAGYEAHLRLGEPTCPSCRGAKGAVTRASKQRVRAAA